MYNFKKCADAYDESKKYMDKGKTASFPPYVTFELANNCNFRCPICHLSYAKTSNREMPLQVLKNAVDEIACHGSMIRFIGYCEPLLYTKVKDAIRYIKDKGLLLHITTNGSLLNDDTIKSFIGSEVDSIIFSFQGLTEKEYCFMRGTTPEVYRKVLNNIKLLHGARGSSKKPYIKITTTVTERDDMAAKDGFMKAHLQHADEVQISGYTSLMPLDTLFGDSGVWDRLKVEKPREVGKVNCFVGN